MVIVVMDYGENMKGSRLVDVLDDNTILAEGMADIYDKFVKLHQMMESTNPNIDNMELRWVENIIEKMEDGYTPIKNDLLSANLYWKKWKKI